jgi:hypothetical protein
VKNKYRLPNYEIPNSGLSEDAKLEPTKILVERLFKTYPSILFTMFRGWSPLGKNAGKRTRTLN